MGVEQLTSVQAATLVTTSAAEETIATSTADPNAVSLTGNPAASHFLHAAPRLSATTAAGLVGTALTLHVAPAAAQVAPVAENLAAVAQSLPPTWQLIVGALLYAEPAIRLISQTTRGIVGWFARGLFGEPPPVIKPLEKRKPTLVDRINEATGSWYVHTRVVGDNILMRSYLGASVLYGAASGKPLAAYLPEAAVLALSMWSGFDMGRVQGEIIKTIERDEQEVWSAPARVDKATLLRGGEITAEAWDREEHQALGVFAPPVPTRFHPSDRIGTNPPPYAEGITPKKSKWYNIKGLLITLGAIGLARRLYAQIESRWDGFTGWIGTLFQKKHAEVPLRFLRTSNYVTRLWASRYLKANQMTVRYHNREALDVIPAGAPIMAVQVNHDSLFLNFASLMYLIPGLRMVADEGNFWTNILLRIFGFSWVMDVIGLLFTKSRGGAKNKVTGSEIEDKARALLKHSGEGIGVAIFPQAGRPPRAWRDDGSLIPPSARSNVVGVQKIDGVKQITRPELYMKNGFAKIAVEAANQSRSSVYIPLILSDDGSGTHGMYFASPKEIKNPPFIGPNLSGQTTNVKIQRVYEVTPGSDADALYTTMVKDALEGLSDDAHLEALVTDWAVQQDTPYLALRFSTLAKADERWYTTVARIAAIHPRYFKDGATVEARQSFVNELLRLLSMETPNASDFDQLLLESAKTVVKTEYRSFS